MAATAAGLSLTQADRRRRLALSAAATRELLALSYLLDPADLNSTMLAWLEEVLELVQRYRERAAEIALTYYASFREAETGRSDWSPRSVSVPRMNEEQVRTSLIVTGPVRARKAMADGMPRDRAIEHAMASASGALTRHIQDAGREVLDRATEDDPEAVAWARVTDGDPCAWCAMLASRGYVYTSRFSARRASGRRGPRPYGALYHDHCQCSAEPAFSDGQEPPGRSLEFEQLWMDSTAGKSGKAAVRAFRRAYERQRRANQ